MQVVILAGGRGTRAYPYTEYLPKPMMPVGGKPILARVMEIFARQGHVDFIVSVGYRKEIIMDYFAHRRNDWSVTIVDTGEETDTGSRIKRCRHILDDTFFATYSDGVCDVDLSSLRAFHQSHDGLFTVTSVPLISQYARSSPTRPAVFSRSGKAGAAGLLDQRRILHHERRRVRSLGR